MANGGALEVDDADALVRPVRSKVAGEEIPMHEAAGAGGDRCQRRLPAPSATSLAGLAGAGAPKRAGHHQSNSVPIAVEAIAVASHDGKPAGGRHAASRPAHRPRRPATGPGQSRPGPAGRTAGRRPGPLPTPGRQASSAAIIDGTDSPRPRRWAAMRRKGRTSSGGGASIRTAGVSPRDADNGGSWHPGRAVRRSPRNSRCARGRARSGRHGSCRPVCALPIQSAVFGASR